MAGVSLLHRPEPIGPHKTPDSQADALGKPPGKVAFGLAAAAAAVVVEAAACTQRHRRIREKSWCVGRVKPAAVCRRIDYRTAAGAIQIAVVVVVVAVEAYRKEIVAVLRRTMPVVRIHRRRTRVVVVVAAAAVVEDSHPVGHRLARNEPRRNHPLVLTVSFAPRVHWHFVWLGTTRVRRRPGRHNPGVPQSQKTVAAAAAVVVPQPPEPGEESEPHCLPLIHRPWYLPWCPNRD